MADAVEPPTFREDMEVLARIIQRVRANYPKMNKAQAEIMKKALTGHSACLVYLTDDDNAVACLDFLKDEKFALSQEANDVDTSNPHGILIKWGSSRRSAIKSIIAAKKAASEAAPSSEEKGDDSDDSRSADEPDTTESRVETILSQAKSLAASDHAADDHDDDEEEEEEVSAVRAPVRRPPVAVLPRKAAKPKPPKAGGKPAPKRRVQADVPGIIKPGTVVRKAAGRR